MITLGPDATCKHPPLRGQGVLFLHSRAATSHRHCPLKACSCFSEGKETSLGYGNASLLPQKSEKQTASKEGHFHAPSQVPSPVNCLLS